VFLDVGARSRAEVEALGIRAGDPIVPLSEFLELAGGRYAGKALDDRVGCVMMIEAMRQLESMKLQATIYFVGTVQEEIGLRGARSAVAAIRPDLGISVEAGIASDHPGGRLDLPPTGTRGLRVSAATLGLSFVSKIGVKLTSSRISKSLIGQSLSHRPV